MDDFPNDAASVLTIDLAALASNIEILRQQAPNAKLAGVVKADAYGLGLGPVVSVHQALGTKTFFVATPDEGAALRALTGPDPEIAVLSAFLPGVAGLLRQHDLTPVLNSLDDVAAAQGMKAMLQIDTGMRRLGLDGNEMQKVTTNKALLNGVELTAILSHFACADEPDHALTAQQYRQFRDFTAHFPGIRRSLSNSSGMFASPDYHFDLVRPGMAVYGLNPVPGQPSPMRAVVSLQTRILQIREVQAGDSVGYGAAYRCKDKRKIATVALGYADGFLRSLSNQGTLFWNGQPCPVAGRVSMDLVTIDVTGLTGQVPVPGGWVEVLGPNQSADVLAESAGTIGYEILTSLGSRYRRVYRGLENSGKTFEIKAISG